MLGEAGGTGGTGTAQIPQRQIISTTILLVKRSFFFAVENVFLDKSANENRNQNINETTRRRHKEAAEEEKNKKINKKQQTKTERKKTEYLF